eukprot:scaffold14438_cov19-Tisochrysis_lutea.AAC.1
MESLHQKNVPAKNKVKRLNGWSGCSILHGRYKNYVASDLVPGWSCWRHRKNEGSSKGQSPLKLSAVTALVFKGEQTLFNRSLRAIPLLATHSIQ